MRSWNIINTEHTTTVLWDNVEDEPIKKLLGKSELSSFVAVITGLRSHLQKIGKVNLAACRAWAKDDETLKHSASIQSFETSNLLSVSAPIFSTN